MFPPRNRARETKWRLEGFTAFVRNAITDRRLILGLTAVGVILTVVVYRMERARGLGWGRLVVPGLLRLSVLPSRCSSFCRNCG